MSINDKITTIVLHSWTNAKRFALILKSIDDTINQVDNNPCKYDSKDPWVLDLQNYRDRVAMVHDRVKARSITQ